jgi:hypothetical protein
VEVGEREGPEERERLGVGVGEKRLGSVGGEFREAGSGELCVGGKS